MDKLRLFFIVVCSFGCAYALHFASTQIPRSAGIGLGATIPVKVVSPAYRALRPNYPYSVIPGGVYSPAELESYLKRDPLVRGHYSDFNLKAARLVSLTEDRLQYVSYRLKDRVYWTRNKLRIPEGETLLTDGIHFARTRCGNRLSSQPKPETSLEQPSAKLLSLPPFTSSMMQMSKVEFAPPPAVQGQENATPLLNFDLPRLAPYWPGESLGSVPSNQQLWPSMASYPPSAGIIAAGIPSGPGYLPSPSSAVPSSPMPNTPESITPPLVPQIPAAPTTPVSEVPEPGSATLLSLSFAGLIWLLTRVMRTGQRASK